MNLNDLLLEDSSVDYKEALETKKPRSWLKSVSAFANSFGGHIVFGIRDNPREVCGLDNLQEVISKITELIKARIDPTPRYQLHAFAEDDKICIDLEIQNGPAYPYYYRFEGVRVAYIRNGDQSEEASRQQLSALILKGMNKTFDALPSPYRIGDVSFTLLAATFKNTLKEDFQPDKDLRSTALVTEEVKSQTAICYYVTKAYCRSRAYSAPAGKARTKAISTPMRWMTKNIRVPA